MQVQAVLIAGPTASGKSALALTLAERVGGIIVNADSMQVYRDLRVLTARPTAAEEARAPHRLYGHVDAADNYSVARYVADAAGTLQASRDGRLPIVVGGTGLYFRALTEGLSDIPPVPEDLRVSVRAQAQGRATPLLHADLAARDPATAATLRPTDRLRILRALEVLAATGEPLVSFRGRRRPGPFAGLDVAGLFLAPPRDTLYAAIDARLHGMIAAGALDEVSALASRRLDPALPAMRAHGVPWLLRHLAGDMSLAEAIAHGQADTRRYAKRQFTWFRHQMPGWRWVTPDEARAELGRLVGQRLGSDGG